MGKQAMHTIFESDKLMDRNHLAGSGQKTIADFLITMMNLQIPGNFLST
jgi:hypothetical protein